MTETIDIRDLPHRLDELLLLSAEGREIVLADGGCPRTRLLPLPPAERVPGLHDGAMVTSDDFDAPLSDDFWTGRT